MLTLYIRGYALKFTSVQNSWIKDVVKILLFLQCRSKFPSHTQTLFVCFRPTWTTLFFFNSVQKRNNHILYIFYIGDSAIPQRLWTNGSRLFRANTMLLLPIFLKITFITQYNHTKFCYRCSHIPYL